jgi:hypothetical protein
VQNLGAGFLRVLFVVSFCKLTSRGIVERGGQDPVGWVVGNRVSYPLDMVEKLTFLSGAIVLGVDDPFDQVLGLAVDNQGRRRRLFSILERIGVFGLQLGDMEHGMNSDSAQ